MSEEKVEAPKQRKITSNQARVLDLLSDGKERSRKEMSEALGIAKGWSRLLGAQENPADDSLEAMGLVKSDRHPKSKEDETLGPLVYKITGEGKKALAAHVKAEAAKEKDREKSEAEKEAKAKAKAEKKATAEKEAAAEKPAKSNAKEAAAEAKPAKKAPKKKAEPALA